MTVAAIVSACWKTSVSFILLLSIIRISLLLLAVDVVDEDIVDVIGVVDVNVVVDDKVGFGKKKQERRDFAPWSQVYNLAI